MNEPDIILIAMLLVAFAISFAVVKISSGSWRFASLVIYTNRFIPKRFVGYAIGPIILIRPKKKGDTALLAHELIHSKQFWATFGLHPIFYALSKRYRFLSEAEAYAEQVSVAPQHILLYASFIATKYRLKVTTDEAVAAIRERKRFSLLGGWRA